MAPKFTFAESPKGSLSLTVEDGPKRTTWVLTSKSRVPTILDVFRGVYVALGGVPEYAVTLPEATGMRPMVVRPDGSPVATTEFREKYARQPSEWDGPGEDTVLEYAHESGKAEPFPAEELLAEPVKHQMTEAESRAILERTTAMLRRRASWVDDPESINPREVNDIDAGQRPPELHPGMGQPSVRVEGRRLTQ